MLNDLKDMYIMYPFLPVESPPEWFKQIKYMRLTWLFGARKPVSQTMNGDFMVAMVTGVSQERLTIHMVCPYYDMDSEVDISIVRDSIPTNASYAYAVGDLPTITGLNYRIHPACFVLNQSFPGILFEVPSGGSQPSMQVAYDGEDITQTMTGTEVYDISLARPLPFENGNNVEVSGSSDSIVFTGAPGAGKGSTWSTAPISADSLPDYQGKGLRSINGMHGNVIFQGDRSVDVNNTNDPAAPGIIITPVRQANGVSA